jgi:hypothetical protein
LSGFGTKGAIPYVVNLNKIGAFSGFRRKLIPECDDGIKEIDTHG